jgi:hypothetical protein
MIYDSLVRQEWHEMKAVSVRSFSPRYVVLCAVLPARENEQHRLRALKSQRAQMISWTREGGSWFTMHFFRRSQHCKNKKCKCRVVTDEWAIKKVVL